MGKKKKRWRQLMASHALVASLGYVSYSHSPCVTCRAARLLNGWIFLFSRHCSNRVVDRTNGWWQYCECDEVSKLLEEKTEFLGLQKRLPNHEWKNKGRRQYLLCTCTMYCRAGKVSPVMYERMYIRKERRGVYMYKYFIYIYVQYMY